jgi:hypothetical protein
MKRLSDMLIALAIFVVGIVIFTALLMRGFVPSEAKLALYTQHMLQHGWSWIPQAYSGLQGFNFSTVVSLAYISALKLGHLTVFSAALPAAVASGVTLGFTYLIGALRNRSWGLVAVLLIVGTEAFFLTSRSLSYAPYITAIVTMSIYFAIEFEQQRIWLYLAQGVLFFLGFIFEGIIGLLLPVIAVCLYLIWRGQFKQFVYQIILAVIMLVIGLALLLVSASSQGGSSLVHHVIGAQLATLAPKVSWAVTPHNWFDLLFYIISLPIAIVTIVLRWHQLVWPKAKWEIQFLRFLISWSAVMIIITIFWGWRPNFMLPMTPALALLGAYIFNHDHVGRATLLVRKILLLLFALLPIAALVFLIVMFSVHYVKNTLYTPFYLHCLVLLVLLSILSVFFFLKRRETIQERSFLVLLFAAITFLIVNIGVVEQVNASRYNVKGLTAKLDSTMKKTPGQLVFYSIGPGEKDMFLMVNLGIDQAPVFVSDSKAVLNETKTTYLIITQHDYLPLQRLLSQRYQVLTNATLAGQPIVVLQHIKPVENPSAKAKKTTVANKESA